MHHFCLQTWVISKQSTIWTIGHSNHPIEEFLGMLQTFDIEWLADIRRFPGSRKYPQFNSAEIQKSVEEMGIGYTHIERLGGRRKVKKDSKNTRWRLDSFRGYADYMETEDFVSGMNALITLAKEKRVAFMCSEAVWWSCHRSLVSDWLKSKGWEVLHIMTARKTQEHPYTKAAMIRNGELIYSNG